MPSSKKTLGGEWSHPFSKGIKAHGLLIGKRTTLTTSIQTTYIIVVTAACVNTAAVSVYALCTKLNHVILIHKQTASRKTQISFA